jgi:hypothetical protein
MLSERGNDRRDIMAITVQQIHPVAHLPLAQDGFQGVDKSPALQG